MGKYKYNSSETMNLRVFHRFNLKGMSMMSELVLYSVERNVAHIQMNRPSKLNALSAKLVEAVNNALKDAEADPSVKAIILSGVGKSFCVGGDLETMKSLEGANEISEWIELTSSLTKTIVDLDKYVIATIHGYAAGAGFSMALACDFIVAEPSAKFALSFTNIGLIPDLGLTKFLTERLPLSIAKEWILSAKVISAKEALNHGIINRIAENDLIEAAYDFSSFLTNGAPLSNKYIKHLLNRSSTSNLDVALMHENMVQTLLLQTVDHHEGISAFIEKRTPNFMGK